MDEPGREARQVARRVGKCDDKAELREAALQSSVVSPSIVRLLVGWTGRALPSWRNAPTCAADIVAGVASAFHERPSVDDRLV
jgi:hypothetical protein